LTGGSFDPTVLDDLRSAGYDRSFESLGDGPSRRSVARRDRSINAPGCTDIIVDATTVMLPVGLGFDAGGIGKGLAADLVATELFDEGVRGVCINIGGDLRVIGESPSGDGWTLAIEHPLSTTPIALVGLAEGAIATSSVLRRTWTREGRTFHHLIDPPQVSLPTLIWHSPRSSRARVGKRRCSPRQHYYAAVPRRSISSMRRVPASLSTTPA
jgi:thiamine biosynthesis lipoprotein